MPQGWPTLTPVGEIGIKTYSAYRIARVTAEKVGKGSGPMFQVLFKHIKDKDIAMTAPVDMGYSQYSTATGPTDMAFLYRSTEQGSLGEDGSVQVIDIEPATFVSLGIRGNYTDKNIKDGIDKLNAWLDAHDEWSSTGPPRYLGYNSPFIPAFLRYGEVQIPVKPAREAKEQEDVMGK